MSRNYITVNPKILKYMMYDIFYSFEKGSLFKEHFDDFLGDGIFNSDGDQWKRQRKTAACLFTNHNFKNNMIKVFSEHHDI